MKNIKEFVKLKEEDIKDLKVNYARAKKDPDFEELVTISQIEDEVAMKYTSSLEDATIEYKNCQNCNSLSFCKNKIKGFIYKPNKNNKTIIFDYVACPYMQKHMKSIEYQNHVDFFQMPKEIKNASLKYIYTDDKNRIEITKYFKEFMDEYKKGSNPKGLYLHGGFGSGKSYLIAALFNEMAKKEVNSVIVYFPELLRSLKESFSGEENEYRDKFNHIKKAPLLLLDDIGAENLTPWGRDEILGSILQYRMEEELPTFFTSNLNLQQLEEHFSITNNGVDKVKAKRIIERVKQLTKEEELTSKNRRQ